MTDTATLNFAWSQTLIAAFIASGVTDAVISPGSRSTPLTMAMLRQEGLRCHIAIDERSAGFFGLGIAKVRRRPVLLLATSGTAIANWLPAVIEANQAGIPLILISADRPPELQDCGSNQTIDQHQLFGTHVRASHSLGAAYDGFSPHYLSRLAAQIVEQSLWPHPGPVHLNQAFREPLVSTETPPVMAGLSPRRSAPISMPNPAHVRDLAGELAGKRGLIVCGELPQDGLTQTALVALSHALGCPILAEPLSGLRFGTHDRTTICSRYAGWLKQVMPEAKLAPEWIIRVGAFPVTRQLQGLVSHHRRLNVLIEPLPVWRDPANVITDLLRCDVANGCQALITALAQPTNQDWCNQVMALELAAADMGEAKKGPIAAALDACPDAAALFIGNSLAVRDLDRVAHVRAQAIPVHANRGASGIDGNIATAAGIAEAQGTCLAIIGDLTCQHDLGSLALARDKNLVIVVVNNGGGGIFAQLPHHQLPEFEQGWLTPQHLSLSAAAQAFGIPYSYAANAAELSAGMQTAFVQRGPYLLEYRC